MCRLSISEALRKKLVTKQEATIYRRYYVPVLMMRELTAEEIEQIV